MNHQNQQKTVVVDLILLFVLVLWTIQLFLLITGLDAYLGGDHGILWPIAASSLGLGGLNLKLVSMIRN
ncbi:DUF6755 family protein [Deinococcus roseus]|uniref:Uncharacterized protein n=1 Tax=Deinococcus roseus TaxID=392414 RepID=A0ABQ2D0V7_9DEIO|nr:DUF6755 family protein [Deinococcus roseus]GGJ35517.1 hypothetical protein GCM10008938_22020 [Deinococcus roseus]